MAAAVERGGDEGLVFMDKFNGGDAVMMRVVYFELLFYHLLVEGVFLGSSDLGQHNLVL